MESTAFGLRGIRPPAIFLAAIGIMAACSGAGESSSDASTGDSVTSATGPATSTSSSTGSGHGGASSATSTSSAGGGATTATSTSSGTGGAGGAGGSPGLATLGTLVVLGDSISDGGGQPPFYYELLKTDLITKYGQIAYHNNAQSGSKTDALVGQIKGLPGTLPGPVAVVITSGGN